MELPDRHPVPPPRKVWRECGIAIEAARAPKRGLFCSGALEATFPEGKAEAALFGGLLFYAQTPIL